MLLLMLQKVPVASLISLFETQGSFCNRGHFKLVAEGWGGKIQADIPHYPDPSIEQDALNMPLQWGDTSAWIWQPT